MVMPGQAISWLNSVCPKATFCQVGQRLPTGGVVALVSRREDSWTVLGATAAPGPTLRHGTPSA